MIVIERKGGRIYREGDSDLGCAQYVKMQLIVKGKMTIEGAAKSLDFFASLPKVLKQSGASILPAIATPVQLEPIRPTLFTSSFFFPSQICFVLFSIIAYLCMRLMCCFRRVRPYSHR